MNIDILIYKQKRFGGLRQIINQEVYTQYKSKEKSFFLYIIQSSTHLLIGIRKRVMRGHKLQGHI